jgi:flagellar biosynthetic protein FliQ
MDMQYIVALGRQAIYTTLVISAPMLILALVVGLAISILQAITQIHEMTLTFIPKIVAVAVALVIFLPWMINTLISYTNQLFAMIPGLTR